ncbi:MAG: GNAT family N-acetyltransferase [Candidatus Heimdallarchaeota archaeon]|nr:GNAT family N-acetyltransferase [Candidatus Heimdallarchaeota archaeon]
MLSIKEKTTIDDWIELVEEYLISSHHLTDKDQITKITSRLRFDLEERKRIVFCAYLNDIPCGFISGSPEGDILEIITLYIKPASYSFNCGFELIKAITTKAFSSSFQHVRFSQKLPFNKESSLEEDLLSEGYLLFQRVQMFLDLQKRNDEIFSLPESYYFEPFTSDKVDQIMKLIVDARSPDHPDYHIYPEMREVDSTKKVFSRFTNNFSQIDPTLNPQLMFNDELIGMSMVFNQNPELAFVGEISLKLTHQGIGLGKALMKKIIDGCSKKGIKQLGVAVTVDNIPAYKLYQKLGFKETDKFLVIIKHRN